MADVTDAAARRSRAAQALRRAIAEMMDSVRPEEPHVVLVGDLNTEPFDAELSADLPTSRSRDVVQRHARRAGTDDLLLYNPSWRLLGEQRPWTGTMLPSLAGTYTTRQRVPSSWRTFDQLLVSSSLLSTQGWVLREDALKIGIAHEAFDPGCEQFLPQSIDHLPITAQLEWLKHT